MNVEFQNKPRSEDRRSGRFDLPKIKQKAREDI